ncbi:hypothetical protein VTL71DRAFT_12021 [Oculimacula yallundae]|uniref:Uncharacterized protein n=1 Tax=Oculimacula yallundae TaxID=86028 RepID=A0ABR4CRP6_9HELO
MKLSILTFVALLSITTCAKKYNPKPQDTKQWGRSLPTPAPEFPSPLDAGHEINNNDVLAREDNSPNIPADKRSPATPLPNNLNNLEARATGKGGIGQGGQGALRGGWSAMYYSAGPCVEKSTADVGVCRSQLKMHCLAGSEFPTLILPFCPRSKLGCLLLGTERLGYPFDGTIVGL